MYSQTAANINMSLTHIVSVLYCIRQGFLREFYITRAMAKGIQIKLKERCYPSLPLSEGLQAEYSGL